MRIHINSKPGLYTVEAFGRNSITLSTKHNVFQVPTSDFKSFAGGIWNHDTTKEEMDLFLSIVQPEEYKKQLDLNNQIIALAHKLDMVETATKELNHVIINNNNHAEVTADGFVDNHPDYDYDNEEDYVIDYQTPEVSAEQYEKWWRQKCDDLSDFKDKMRSVAREIYSGTIDHNKFQNRKGVKFIIQQDHYDEKINRFCWDPYGFVSNGHSDISSIYREADWGTKSGGWIKIIDNNVILYAQSGDYGVYDNATAVECAAKLFTGKKIYSFPGRQWDDELTNMFDDLPF
jgi:hypothetical protein